MYYYATSTAIAVVADHDYDDDVDGDACLCCTALARRGPSCHFVLAMLPCLVDLDQTALYARRFIRFAGRCWLLFSSRSCVLAGITTPSDNNNNNSGSGGGYSYGKTMIAAFAVSLGKPASRLRHTMR